MLRVVGGKPVRHADHLVTHTECLLVELPAEMTDHRRGRSLHVRGEHPRRGRTELPDLRLQRSGHRHEVIRVIAESGNGGLIDALRVDLPGVAQLALDGPAKIGRSLGVGRDLFRGQGSSGAANR